MARKKNNLTEAEKYRRKYGASPLDAIVAMLKMSEYKGWSGYNKSWGQYIGVLGTMVYYLKFINQVEYAKMDVLLKARNKGGKRLSPKEIQEEIYRIWRIMPYDLQRKFEHHVMFYDKDFRRKYNIARRTW